MLEPGDRIPDIALCDTAGRDVPLSSFRGKPLVLYFYPKDGTPGCTMQACSFRDAYEDFTAAGAEVVGVSSDTGAAHDKFAGANRLQFRLLTDRGGAAQRAFGVPKTFGVLPGRVTFVIDGDGVVRHSFNGQFQIGQHVPRALEALKGLKTSI